MPLCSVIPVLFSTDDHARDIRQWRLASVMCWKAQLFMGTELLSPHRQLISSPTRYGLRSIFGDELHHVCEDWELFAS